MSHFLQQAVRQQLQALLSHVAPNPAPTLHLQNDLGLDSLGVVGLVVTLEQHFNVNLPDAEIGAWTTLGDVYESLERQGIDNAPPPRKRSYGFFK